MLRHRGWRPKRRQKANYEEYKKYVNLESAQAIIGGWSGVDLSQFDEGRGPELRADRVDSSPPDPLHPAGEDKKWTRKVHR